MFAKLKERRRNERKLELEEFLRSAEGRRVMFELAPDILVSGKLDPILDQIRARLEGLTAGAIQRFTFSIETTLKTAESHFSNFLCSQQGRLMLDLLVEALAKGELTSVLDGAEERLKNLAEELVAAHTAHAELSLERSAEARAAALKRSASEAARNLADEIAHDVQQQLKSYRASIVEAVREQLPVALREEVARHVKGGPLFSPICSNRALAAAHGISIREVKRRRRNGWL